MGIYQCTIGFRPIDVVATMTAVCVVDSNDATIGQWFFEDCTGELL